RNFGRAGPYRRRERGGEHRVDLDGVHPRGRLHEAKRERAQPGTDLDHDIVGREIGGDHDPPYRVRVVHEVLSERLGWTDAERRREVAYLGRPQEPGWRRGHCHGPKTRSPVAEIPAHTASRSRPVASASPRTVIGMRYGALGRPRYGIWVRYGASVSTSICSGGVSRAASRNASAFLNVTVPAKLSTYPRRTHSAANGASPEKQCITTVPGAPSSSRMRRTSSCASRSWIISGLPTRFAIAMWARKLASCAARPSSPVRYVSSPVSPIARTRGLV